MTHRTITPVLRNLGLRRLAVLFALATLSVACAEQVAGSERTPSEALVVIMQHAQKGDVAKFKQGLSINFQLVIERYQEMGETTPEVKDAFSFETFMRALANAPLTPKEEIIKGKKATVRALDPSGQWKSTEMVLENGIWKLEVPNKFVTGLDHYDETIKRLKGEKVAARPDIGRGGGGKADRVKNLPKGATQSQQEKAKALDTFDLGDVAGAIKVLEAVQIKQPTDEELTVALGRAYVQEKRGPEGIKLLSAFLKTNSKSSAARHYIGMAYMFEKRYDLAAANWKRIAELDPDYAKEWDLSRKATIAEAMHKGETFNPAQGQAGGGPGAMPPAGGGARPGGAASQPRGGGGAASQPAR